MASKLTDNAYLLLTALAEGQNHGYALARRVGEITSGEVAIGAGTLYSNLDRLLAEGLIVEAGEEIVDGRARRNYRISQSGTREIVERVQQLRLQVDAMNAALRLA